jgi:hypothetical protein
MLNLIKWFVTSCILLSVSGLMMSHISGDLQAAEIYTWVDANGVTHYSDKPLKSSKKVDLYLPVQKKAEEAEKKAEPVLFDAKDTARLALECENARKNILALNSGNTVLKKDAEGNDVEIDTAEKTTQLKQNQDYLDTYCNDVDVPAAPEVTEETPESDQ